MINKKYSLFFVLVSLIILISSFIIAESPIKANYQIIEDSVLVEINFESVKDLKLEIPYDAKAIELNTKNYVLKDLGNYKELKITSAQNLEIKYITKALIDKSENEYFFVLENPFNQPVDIMVYLPESAILSEKEIIFPKTADIITDGRRIILNWKNLDGEEILVFYEFIERSNLIFYIVIGILITGLLTSYFIQARNKKQEIKKIKRKTKEKKSQKKKEEKLTKNLFADEKRIVKYLLNKKRKECWTKEIVKDLNINKVKLSRKIRSLEQKEIIKKIPYGNENKIRLLNK
jgi:uncharacterized membrane protein